MKRVNFKKYYDHITTDTYHDVPDEVFMEITHFERGSGLISTNNNNITVEFKCSQLEKDLITTDRRELQELIERTRQQNEELPI